jgi:hypothetical protein
MPVKRQVQERLWEKADALDWASMTVIERTKQYGLWVSDPEIGGVLAGYLDARRVRTYMKDTLMKPYARQRMSDITRALDALGLETMPPVLERYERPHGVRLEDGVISWGKADDWKLVLLAAHERAFARNVPIRGVVLLPPLSRFVTAASRAVIEDACTKLGVSQLAWLDPHDQLAEENWASHRH